MDEIIRKRYEALKSKIITRKPEFDKFIEFLEKETTWLTSPASTRFHLNKEGGLLEHSVGVTETLLKLKELLAPDISEESCLIVALFHDAGKLGEPGKPYYIKNDDKWQAEKRNITYKTNPEVTGMGLAVRSLYLVSKHIKLSDSEAQAIAYHDGQYIEENKVIAHKETQLTLLLTFADTWSAAVNEDGRKS